MLGRGPLAYQRGFQPVGGHALVVEGGAQPLLDLAPLGVDVPGHDQVPAGLALVVGQGRDGQVVDAGRPVDLLAGLVDPGGHGGHRRSVTAGAGDGLADDLGRRLADQPAGRRVGVQHPAVGVQHQDRRSSEETWPATGRRSSRLNW